MMFDTADSMIEVFDPLMELRVGQFQERAHLSKFPIHVVAVFGVPAVQMHLKSLGHRLDVMAKAFDQNSGVPLGFFSRGGDVLAEVVSGSDDFLAEFSGRGSDVLAEGSGRGSDFLAEVVSGSGDVLAEFSGRGSNVLAESSGRGSDFLAEVVSGSG
ncbi:MAG: hypothetical protein NNA21_03125, partial [Nitrospira sp.]|nr:hypothetical protein [Nitrospira sp.]